MKLTIAFLIIFICALCQLNGYLNLDTSWLITASERWLAGEKLNQDFVETNPPLIIYLTSIGVMFGGVSGFIIFISALAALSLWLTAKYEKSFWVFIGLVFALVAMPTVTFGQREHLLLIFILPYFYLLISGEKRGVVAAILAGIGFAIKPFFIIYWAAFALADRRIFRLENFIIGGIIAIYVAYLVFIEKNYVNEVLPLLIKYYDGMNYPLNKVLQEVGVNLMFYSLPLFVLCFFNKDLINRKIAFAFIGLVASCIIMLVQQKVWTNYMLPISFFGFLLSIFIIDAMRQTFRKLLWYDIIGHISWIIILITIGFGVFGNYRIAKKDEDIKKMIAVLNQRASGKPVYSLSFDLGALFPAVTYSDAEFKGKYPHLWMLPSMKDSNETFVKEAVTSDLLANPPAIIVVTNRKYNSAEFGDFEFDFIKYFSQSPEFADIFKNYEKVDRVDELDIYKYKD